MFARLFLCDLFIHGLGGAKYDEITDIIIRRFWRVEPPRFLVLSGSLRLPFRRSGREWAEIQKLQRIRRELCWKPERHLSLGEVGETASRLAEEKSRLISQEPDNSVKGRERFLQLRRLTHALRSFVSDRKRRLGFEIEQCRRELELDRVLGDREFPFCLFPEAKLRPFCQQFLAGGRRTDASASCLVRPNA